MYPVHDFIQKNERKEVRQNVNQSRNMVDNCNKSKVISTNRKVIYMNKSTLGLYMAFIFLEKHAVVSRKRFQIGKKLLVFLLCLGYFLSSAPVLAHGEEAPKESELYSRSCVLMDGYSGRILYGKSPDNPMANASTTKILTCILALENGKLTDRVAASERAARQPKVRLGMTVGEEYVLEDLLYCLMLESFNDCAVAIAENISGSVEEFAALMNQKAVEIGCKDSYFITPNGLDDSDENGFHHTTAEDLCLIMKYCAWESPKREEFLKITRTASYTFSDSQGVSHTAYNHNQLLTTMDGALSGKTGFTADAGYCYIMAYEKDGKRFCAAFLACGWPNNKNYKWKDAAKLIAYGTAQFTNRDLYVEPDLPKIQIEQSCPLNPSLNDWQKRVCLQPQLQLAEVPQLTYMLAKEDIVNYEIRLKQTISPPLEDGDAVGCYEIQINGETIREYPVIAGKSAEKWDFKKLCLCILKYFSQIV